jgi:transcriptional antiterminator NusG
MAEENILNGTVDEYVVAQSGEYEADLDAGVGADGVASGSSDLEGSGPEAADGYQPDGDIEPGTAGGESDGRASAGAGADEPEAAGRGGAQAKRAAARTPVADDGFYDDADEHSPRWYVVHTYSGHENKVKSSIEKQVESFAEKIEIDFPLVDRFGNVVEAKMDESGVVERNGRRVYLCDMADLVRKINVPMHDVTVIKEKESKVKSRKMFPGYILVKMIVEDKSWFLVRNTSGVTGFVGYNTKERKNRPVALSKEEVRRMGIEKVVIELDFSVGDSIKVINGPFESFIGVVEEVNPERETLKARITMFGRETPVELIYDQVDKIY